MQKLKAFLLTLAALTFIPNTLAAYRVIDADKIEGSATVPNFVRNSSAEVNVSGWAAFADAAASIPVDLTGGSPNVTIARTTTAGEVLAGVASFKLTKGAANRQGEGVSAAFTVPPAYQGKPVAIRIHYRILSGSLSKGDVKIFVYDATNSILITPVSNDIAGTVGEAVASFQTTPSASTPADQTYRVALYFATTSATAVTIGFDDVKVAPIQGNYGIQQEQVISFSAASASMSVSSQLVKYNVTPSQSGNGLLSYDNSGSNTKITVLKDCNLVVSWSAPGSNSNRTADLYKNGSEVARGIINLDGSSNVSGGSFTTPAVAGDYFEVVLGSPSSILASYRGVFTAKATAVGPGVITPASTFQISDYLVSGTRVTGSAPTALGQYRSYLRAAGATTFSETNGTPTATPSVTNGMALYNASGYSSADSSGQPSKYEIFVGKNVHPKLYVYASTGRTGFVDITPTVNGVTTIGYVTNYAPSTGIFTITPDLLGTATTLKTGMDTVGGYTSSPIYFDISVSQSTIPIQSTIGEHTFIASTPSGNGSTNTRVRNFTVIERSVGTAITGTISGTAGTSALINEDGLYSVEYQYESNGGTVIFCVTKNSSALTSNPPDADVISITSHVSAVPNAVATVRYFRAGDIIRPQNYSTSTPNSTSGLTKFLVTKVSN